MGNEIRPKEIQKLLEKVEGTPQEALISRLALRSMKQARYTPENAGHFGLAAQYYTHFTSPIRRYPDLQIHRIIKENLRGRLSDDRMAHYEKILPEVATQSSEMERRAEEAERETVKLKKSRIYAGSDRRGIRRCDLRYYKMGSIRGTAEYDRRSCTCGEYEGRPL